MVRKKKNKKEEDQKVSTQRRHTLAAQHGRRLRVGRGCPNSTTRASQVPCPQWTATHGAAAPCLPAAALVLVL